MVTFNVDSLDFVDDEEARFGAGADYSARYSSSNSRLELEDLTNATVGFVPQNVGTDLVGGKFAETVSEGKALADDGNVYDTIQEAVGNANSWVKVGPGQFRESVTIETEGLTLEGSGERTVISLGDSVKISSNNVTISKLKITKNHNKTTSTASINIDSGDGTIVRDTFIENSTYWSILHSTGTNTHANFVGNRIEGGVEGIACTGESSATISNNYISVKGNGINMTSDDAVCCFNVVKDCSLGINLKDDDNLCLGNRILNCKSGIEIQNNGNLVAKNRISGADTDITDDGTGTVLDSNLTT